MTAENKALVQAAFPTCIINNKGVVTVKQSYFYRRGTDGPERLAGIVLKHFPAATILDKQDSYKAWPKTSYYIVKFKL